MAFFARFKRSPPPTTTDCVEAEKRIPDEEDIEKVDKGIERENRHQPRHHDAAAERAVVRKLDLRVPVLLGVLYLLSFLDRSNIGNARIAGMIGDLDLEPNPSSNRYQWLLTVFYISYILFEFLTIMWKIMPAHIWASIIVFAWGLSVVIPLLYMFMRRVMKAIRSLLLGVDPQCVDFLEIDMLILLYSRIATVQAGVRSWQGEMALRFFLGVTEAGFGPGVPFLLSFFYLRHEVGLRIGIFLSAAPLANTFAGALAYGITSGHSKLANWRLLFLVEGLPTMIMAVVAFFFLPDSPDKASFLTEEEKLIAKARGVRQVGDVEKRVGGVAWKDVGAALMDAKCWFTALMYFSCNVGFSSLPVFLPTILEGMNYSSVNAQGLTAPPYFLSFLVTIFSTWVADRIQQRAYVIIVLTAIGGIGYILLAACNNVGVRYFGVFLAASGIFPTIANILPWVTNNQGSDTRRGVGIVLLNLIGQCGPLLGTNVFPKNQGPRYVKGMAICAAFTWFTGVLAVSLRLLLVWENKKLDKKYGTRTAIIANRTGNAAGHESVQCEENYGETFRYIL